MLIIFPIVARIYGIKYIELMKEIKDLLLIAFSTRSLEVLFAPLTSRLEKYGANNSVVSFILPLGYSFNLDGSSVYLGPVIVFLANAYGIHFSLGQTIEVILLLMLLTKGVAGVPSASIVILATICTILHIPLEGIALLLAVDYIMDMPRTAVSAAGNALATVAIAKSE